MGLFCQQADFTFFLFSVCLYIKQTFPTTLRDISHFFAALVKCLPDCQDHIIGNIQGSFFFFFGTLRSVYIKFDTTKWHEHAQYLHHFLHHSCSVYQMCGANV